MAATIEILLHIARTAMELVWELLGTTVYGYWLVPFVGAVIGWIRTKKRFSMKALLNAPLTLSLPWPLSLSLCFVTNFIRRGRFRNTAQITFLPTPPSPPRNAEPETPRRKSPPSLVPVFYDKDDLRFWLVNTGDFVAIAPKFTFGLTNMSNPYHANYDGKGLKVEPLPIPTRKVDDYVRPHESLSTFIVLNDLSKPYARQGDRLLGQFFVLCQSCNHQRNFWLFWVVGVGGWYYEIPQGKPTNIPFIQSEGWTNEQIDSAANALAPFNKRVTFYPDLEAMQRANNKTLTH